MILSQGGLSLHVQDAGDVAVSHVLSQVGQEHWPHGPVSFVSPLYSGCMWGPCTVVLNLNPAPWRY